ncbi:MAG TPA: 50S ribosomal protein L22 [Kiritimatiellia bacterium]|nr:50S ribosomal protein L22 [Kiritimatiellia bacterium]HMO98827.1 50S ribosomal protein L22 [Kiritimatiellia bacterium]HMP96225.1 50S ribosomal protein L22 [Kiritimatiellia bacterium]
MDVMALTKDARISPTKARDLARTIQGRSASEALKITQFSERKAAFYIGKTLKSAIANAENNHSLSADDLTVKSALVDQGHMMKRFQPKARGSAGPIQKKMSHIKIVLTDNKGEAE